MYDGTFTSCLRTLNGKKKKNRKLLLSLLLKRQLHVLLTIFKSYDFMVTIVSGTVLLP